MFRRMWVRIPAPDTVWTFFTLICCKNCNVCLKRPKINEKKKPGKTHFLKKNYHIYYVIFCYAYPLSHCFNLSKANLTVNILHYIRREVCVWYI